MAALGRPKKSRAKVFAPNARAGAQWTESMLDSLIEFRKEVTQKLVRKAVAAGAKVLYEEIKVRAQGYEGQYAGPVMRIQGDDGQQPLSETIYYAYDRQKSGFGRGPKHVYVIGPKKNASVHWAMVEYGHWRINEVIVTGDGVLIPLSTRLPAKAWVPPRPYVRPAWDAKAQQALAAILAEMKERLAGITTVGFD